VGASSFNVYLGLAATPQRLGITDHETFVNLDYNQEMHYEKMKYAVSPPAIAVTCYNSIWPEISPPDTSIVVLTALMYGEPWRRIKPADYVDVKTSIADDMLRLAERIAPGLRERAEVVEVSTPITNMRYANQLGGSIYGFDQPPGEAMIFRMPHWGPLKGLFFCGAWTPPGGGFEPVMISGRLAAEQALMTMKAKRPAKGA
jgi:prolycopene isomerase